MIRKSAILALILFSACSRLEGVGKVPEHASNNGTDEHFAMMRVPIPNEPTVTAPSADASLWRSGRRSLLGNQRAQQIGDIITVVVEIDEKAEISNQSSRGRSGSEELSIPSLIGIPQKINEKLPAGASLDNAVSTDSSSSSSGQGKISRNEKFSMRIAATVVDVLQNGVLSIQGSQEVRVNFELRELLVTGFVRPADISRKNEISYDKIASARISYGGRGQITDVQQPRYGQQVTDVLLPF